MHRQRKVDKSVTDSSLDNDGWVSLPIFLALTNAPKQVLAEGGVQ